MDVVATFVIEFWNILKIALLNPVKIENDYIAECLIDEAM